MTKAQEEAIEQIQKLAELHFDSYLLTVRAATHDNDEDDVSCFWNGSITHVLGMNKLTQIRLEHYVFSRTDLSDNQQET